jgi:muconolactone D-isomerase
MLFMLHIDVTLPPDMPQSDKDALRTRENARAAELVESRTLRRIWRVVGRMANYSVWEADTLEALHAAIQSQPMFPYMKITVTPLVEHPVTEAWVKQRGEMPAF